MALYASRCIRCGDVGSADDSALGECEPTPDGPDKYPANLNAFIEEYQDEVRSGGSTDLCDDCHNEIVAFFKRDGKISEGTLASVLSDFHSTWLDLLAEKTEHGWASRELEYQRKYEREQVAIAEILRRVGKPVCHFDTFGDEEDEFIVHQLNDDGLAFSTSSQPYDLGANPEIVCALDYAPDGSPLT